MVKERADGSPQLNLRVPVEHHERVRRVVVLLRTAESFPARLDELLASASEPLTPSLYAEIMARLERLEAAVFSPTAIVKQVAARPARTAIKQPTTSNKVDSGASIGRKKGDALTPEILAEVRRLLETTDMSNPQIGKRVGISKETVRKIKLAM